MRTISDAEFSDMISRKGQNEKHDYELLFNGEPHILERGVDFTGDPNSKRVSIQAAGRRYGVKVKTGLSPEGDVIIRAKAIVKPLEQVPVESPDGDAADEPTGEDSTAEDGAESVTEPTAEDKPAKAGSTRTATTTRRSSK
jgi:hypothetical protein